jgi:hypothetical protein
MPIYLNLRGSVVLNIGLWSLGPRKSDAESESEF